MNLFSVFHKTNSGEIARNRLKLLLAADKVHCSPEMMQMIKDDMVHVISRYMDVDSEGIEIQMTRKEQPECGQYIPVLYANIPIRNGLNKGIY